MNLDKTMDWMERLNPEEVFQDGEYENIPVYWEAPNELVN